MKVWLSPAKHEKHGVEGKYIYTDEIIEDFEINLDASETKKAAMGEDIHQTITSGKFGGEFSTHIYPTQLKDRKEINYQSKEPYGDVMQALEATKHMLYLLYRSDMEKEEVRRKIDIGKIMKTYEFYDKMREKYE